jgi:hypothetical protein
MSFVKDFWEDDQIVWPREPDTSSIERICRQRLALLSDATCTVSLMAEGSRNKVYSITTDDLAYVMRVCLPLDPLKVSGEVATMEFVRQKVGRRKLSSFHLR